MKAIRSGEFRTGRDYGSPQVIRWAMVGKNTILFRDEARNIHGEITTVEEDPDSLFFDKYLWEQSAVNIGREVLGYYDQGLYVWSAEARDL